MLQVVLDQYHVMRWQVSPYVSCLSRTRYPCYIQVHDLSHLYLGKFHTFVNVKNYNFFVCVDKKTLIFCEKNENQLCDNEDGEH